MKSWRTLLTPNMDKYIDSFRNDNSNYLQNETPNQTLNISNNIFSCKSANILNETKNNENLNYKQKLEKIQNEISELKRKKQEKTPKNSENIIEISTQHDEIIQRTSKIKSLHINSELKVFRKKTFSRIDENENQKIQKRRTPSYMNFCEISVSPINNEIDNHSLNYQNDEKKSDSSLSHKSCESDYSINFISLVHKLQKSLRKEKKKSKLLAKQLDHIQKENTQLKLKLQQFQKFPIKKIDNLLQITSVEDSNIKGNEETIRNLMSTKRDLVDTIEQILQIFTTNDQSEFFLSKQEDRIKSYMKKVREKQKEIIVKINEINNKEEFSNLPLQFNKNENEFTMTQKEKEEKKILDTSNNLIYTPSNNEGLSFLSNLKDSKIN